MGDVGESNFIYTQWQINKTYKHVIFVDILIMEVDYG